MGYRLNTDRIFRREVKVILPADDGTGDKTVTVAARFRMLTTERYQRLVGEGNLPLLREALHSVDDLEDMDGKPIPSDLSAEAALAEPWLVHALHSEYVECLSKKNSFLSRT